jgi:hypothetical protein
MPDNSELLAKLCKSSGPRLVQIKDVRREEIDGRPQLVLDVLDEQAGLEFTVLLDRETARELTRMFGPHPLVEEFFKGGEGLQ